MKHILIVDDDEDDCDLFIEAIKLVDINIDCAKVFNGKLAMELLGTEYRPDLIFLDINMPVLDGKKCLVEIGKSEPLAGIPVIIYSTSKRKVDFDETRHLGASYFITKTSSLDELCAEIGFVLNRGWEGAAADLTNRPFLL